MDFSFSSFIYTTLREFFASHSIVRWSAVGGRVSPWERKWIDNFINIAVHMWIDWITEWIHIPTLVCLCLAPTKRLAMSLQWNCFPHARVYTLLNVIIDCVHQSGFQHRKAFTHIQQSQLCHPTSERLREKKKGKRSSVCFSHVFVFHFFRFCHPHHELNRSF